MSRGSTGRDFCMPGGYDTAVTAAGNIMLCRVMILYTIAIARGLLAILEQPSSSLMQHHWRFQQLIRNHAMYMTHHYLGYFLAESPKPIKLYSNWPILQTVNNYKTRSWLPESEGVYQQWVGGDGRKRVAGDTGLKNTQAYPLPFGRAIARVYADSRDAIDSAATSVRAAHSHSPPNLDTIFNYPCTDFWEDANLGPVLAVLQTLASARGQVA